MSGLTRCAVVSACLFAAAIAVHAAGGIVPVPLQRPLAHLPTDVGGWHGEDGPALDTAVLSTLGVDDFVNRIYSRPGLPPAALYVGYYGSQAEGDRIHSPLNCLPGAGWQAVERSVTTIALAAVPGSRQSQMQVNRLVIEKGLDRDLVLYWYQSHGRVTAGEYWGRALLVMDALRLGRTDGALVRVIVPLPERSPDARAASEGAAAAFVQAVFPVLGAFLPR